MAPAFILKTYALLEDPETDHYIRWTPAGDSFIVSNVEAFQQNVLGKHFNHSNFCSFVRQLNLYGFHKLSGDPSNSVFHFGGQPLFHRDSPSLLSQIKRRTTNKTKRKNDDIQASEPKRDRLPSDSSPGTQRLSDDASARTPSPDLNPDCGCEGLPAASEEPAFVNPLVDADDASSLPASHLLLLLAECRLQILQLNDKLAHAHEENKALQRQLADLRPFHKTPSSPDPSPMHEFENVPILSPLEHHSQFPSSEYYPGFVSLKHELHDYPPLSPLSPLNPSDPSWLAQYTTQSSFTSFSSPEPSHEDLLYHEPGSPTLSDTLSDFAINQMFDSFTFGTHTTS
ncbi:MAG: heat shock factor family protein [archaeon]|nr:heat shock factor family protein [archaeon]